MASLFQSRDFLDEIFAWLPSGDLTRTLRVNSLWFHASVHKLWRVIDLGVVLGMGLPAERLIDDDEDSIVVNWKHYAVYSAAVRILRGNGLHFWFIEALDRSRPETMREHPIFPSCRTLSWVVFQYYRIHDLDLLISPTLKDLSISVPSFYPAWFDRVCDVLIARVSALCLLNIVLGVGARQMKKLISSFHRILTFYQKSLQNVRIPKAFATSVTFAKLHDLKGLRELVLDQGRIKTDERTLSSDFRNFSLRSSGANFQFLRILSLSLPTGGSFINDIFSRSRFPTLNVLQWEFFKQPHCVNRFFDMIVNACPELHVLHIDGLAAQPTTMSWECLQRILKLENLSALTLYPFTVGMDLEQYVQLLTSRTASRSWRVLEVFTETPFPLHYTMSLLATHCPKLRFLGFYAHDTDEHPDKMSLPPYYWPLHPSLYTGIKDCPTTLRLESAGFPFLFLTSINFGRSNFSGDSLKPVASFLAAITQNPPYLTGQDYNYWIGATSHIGHCYTFLAYVSVPIFPPPRRYLQGHENVRMASVSVQGQWFDIDEWL